MNPDNLPANQQDVEDDLVATAPGIEFDGPSGFEDVTSDCITIPFLKIAQGLTEEAQRGNAKYIDGLQVGNFFCPATRKVYGERVKLVILKFYRQYVIYDSKESNAKFVGTMSAEQFKADVLPNATREKSYHLDAKGQRYVDTRNFIVMIPGHYNDGPMLLSLSSTGIAPSRKLLTMATNVRADDGRQAPIWSSVWELEIGYQTSDLGSYYQIGKISRLGWVPVKYAKLIVAAFLDAQGYSEDVLEASAAKGFTEKAAEGDHSFEPAGRQPATAPGEDEEELF